MTEIWPECSGTLQVMSENTLVGPWALDEETSEWNEGELTQIILMLTLGKENRFRVGCSSKAFQSIGPLGRCFL